MFKIRQNRSKSQSENGNVLFIILIAVALFGALSFAVSNMMRGGGAETLTQDKATLYAGEILDKAQEIRLAVQDSRTFNDCEDTDISFDSINTTGYAHTPAASTDCQIFNAATGKLSYSNPPADWLDTTQTVQNRYGEWFFTGESCIYDMGTGSTDCATANGADDSDLIAVMPWIKLSICQAVNESLGLTDFADDPLVASGIVWDADMDGFTGTYTADGSIQSAGSDATILTAAPAGCFSNSGGYHVYQILIAR